MPQGQGYTPFSGGVNLGGNQQNSLFQPDIWGGIPFAPGQGGQNSLPQMGGVGQGTGFDWGGVGQGITQGLGGLTSLAQIYGMFQNLGLQKKAFKFAREGTKRNFNASATGFNNEVQRREGAAQAYAQQNGGDYASLQNYGRVEKWS